jgi:four helix bundle protein
VSYRNLDIWTIAKQNTILIHEMTLSGLPKFETYEEARQIRRSVKSVRSNIVEGYGRRRYKLEFMRFLTFAIASNDETMDHLEILYETGSLKNEKLNKDAHAQIDMMGKKLNMFIHTVQAEYNANKYTLLQRIV